VDQNSVDCDLVNTQPVPLSCLRPTDSFQAAVVSITQHALH